MKNLVLFFVLVALAFSLIYIFNCFLITKEAFYNTFQNQLENEMIDKIFNSETEHFWISYIFIPIWLLLKIFIISLCLQAGLTLNNKKLDFSGSFNIALTAEFVFLLPQILKLAWFLLVKTEYTLIDIQQFYPLSALNLFKIENLSTLLIYPFQALNIFEILYWILLAGGIKQALNTNIDDGIRVVFSGYIPALVLWIMFVMFITISLSPAT